LKVVFSFQNNDFYKPQKQKMAFGAGLTPKPEQTKDRLIPVTKWNDYYDFPKLGGLRALIFNEHKNGFHKVVRRIGRCVLIKEDEFFKWVEENNS